MSLGIISAEIVSALFLMIILLSLRITEEKESLGNRLFQAFTVSAEAGLIFDILSYCVIGQPVGNGVMILINILAFATIGVCIVLFSFYLIVLLQSKIKISFKPIYPVIAISVLNILMIIIGAFNGRFFRVEAQEFVYGPWNSFISIMPVFSLIIILIIIYSHASDLGERNTVVLATFVIFPIIASVILFFQPLYGLGYPAIALSSAVIFTFIRRQEINEAHNREHIIKEFVSLDVLTGLLNRRGFNEAMGEASDHACLGIAFCDLNALKYTNDTYGHDAGDVYIKSFADILKRVYGSLGPICRISGDEFVVLLYDIPREKFDKLKDELNLAIKENEWIASAGYAYGDTATPMNLLLDAEQEMYSEKNRFYRETGLDRRRDRPRQIRA